MIKIYILFLVVGASLVNSAPQQLIRIISQSGDTNPDGGYKWSYETENGIKAEETGILKKASGPDAQDTIIAQGAYEYKDLEGKQISLTYNADDVNGFQPVGEHLPTPPPIPPAILKALTWIQEHPSAESNPKK